VVTGVLQLRVGWSNCELAAVVVRDRKIDRELPIAVLILRQRFRINRRAVVILEKAQGSTVGKASRSLVLHRRKDDLRGQWRDIPLVGVNMVRREHPRKDVDIAGSDGRAVQRCAGGDLDIGIVDTIEGERNPANRKTDDGVLRERWNWNGTSRYGESEQDRRGFHRRALQV